MDNIEHKILLIEDNLADIRLIKELLSDTKLDANLKCANSLSKAIKYLEEETFDIILLDLGLPDSQGIKTFSRINSIVPKVPIIILTGTNDDDLSIQAIREGAQDYLIKGLVDTSILKSALRHSIERKHLLVKLESIELRKLEQNELELLERLSDFPKTVVTARLYGLAPLRESLPDNFYKLVKKYENLIELAIEQRIYKVKHNTNEQLRAIAEEMGFLNAGPRDVVEIHSHALKKKINSSPYQKSVVYTEEGHFLALKLMGYLVSYYRKYSMIAKQSLWSESDRRKEDKRIIEEKIYE